MRAKVIGHTAQRESLSRIFLRGSLPSTILFSGPAGIGKSLAAIELASLIFCEQTREGDHPGPGGCGHCHTCRVLDAGNMPDFYLLDCGSRDEGAISQVRELLYSLHLRSFSSPYRVIILDQVEKLSLQAANVLLKSIEEPRPDSFFILITSNAARMPVTVRSRSQEWRFMQLSNEEMREVVRIRPDLVNNQNLSESALSELLVLADGSPANLAQLHDKLDVWEEIKNVLDSTFEGDPAAGIRFSSAAGKNREGLPALLQLARMHARRRMHEAADPLAGLKWSYALSNFIAAEHLIFNRNLNASYVLNATFAALYTDPALDADCGMKQNEYLIEKITV